MPSKVPVIFLAFANDRVDNTAYLRNLPKELSGIRDALQAAVKAGLCEVVERPNATIHQILGIFQNEAYRDRIAVFHYGGHANGYQLLLENLDGTHASAHSEGLVSFLAKQRGLQLVFLNGCSSQQQAMDMVQAGIPAVIGTSQSINDDVATALALRFYGALGNGANLSRAWDEAADEVRIQKGSANMRDLFWEGGETEVIADRFPWDIYFREGEELVKGWNLPDTVENPLFGLPEPLANYDLPAKPYRFLERYKREHAELFFGRSYYIRDLFNNAVDPKASPVVLFYGQSGVGKSSMLDAGLFPRLERVCQVVYIRRRQDVGLLGTLRDALGMGQQASLRQEQASRQEQAKQEQLSQLEWVARYAEPSVKVIVHQAMAELRQSLQEELPPMDIDDLPEDASLKEYWLAMEAKAGQPLVILLDQAEEVFTRPNPELKNELDDFLAEVKAIFGQAQQRPQGKLILSYRKEYHPEMKEAFTALAIPKSEIFLKALVRKDIAEIITGLTKTLRTRQVYRLEIEPELPIVIADDLLEDKDSPIAPVLQILLTKMWNIEEAKQDRFFSVKQYQELRKQGILMGDFFHEQMEQLLLLMPEAVTSGLALDVLHFHTTRMGTADTKLTSDLHARYEDRIDEINQLLAHFKMLYLLTDAGANRTGLAHDTIAPLVIQEYQHSDKPGQRASIILDNKLIAFSQNDKTIIDQDDLRIVEAGALGMRLWSEKERELIDKSRAMRNKRMADQRLSRRLRMIAVVVILLGAFVSIGLYLNAERERMNAEKARTAADEAKLQAENSAKIAKEEREIADGERKKAESAKKSAEQSAQIAMQQEEEARKQQRLAELAKQSAEYQAFLADSANKVSKESLVKTKKAQEQERLALRNAEISRQEAEYQLLISTARQVAIKSSLVRKQDTLQAQLALTAYNLEHTAKHKYSDRGPDSQEDTHEIFEAMEQAFANFSKDSLLAGEAWSVQQAGEWLFLSEARGKAKLGKIEEEPNSRKPILKVYASYNDLGKGAKVYAVAPLKDDQFLLGLSNGAVVWASLMGAQPFIQEGNAPVAALLVLNDSKYVAIAHTDGKVAIWDIQSKTQVANHKATVNTFVAHENWLYGACENGQLLRWNSKNLTQAPEVFWTTSSPIRSMDLHPSHAIMALGTAQGNIHLLEINTRAAKVFTNKHKGSVQAIAFSPNGRLLSSASFDGSIFTWKLPLSKTDIVKLYLQIPAVILNGPRIFSIHFDSKSRYLLFSDAKAMKIRLMDAGELKDQLSRVVGGKPLSEDNWGVYVGDHLERPKN